jgi:hypothetical protein
MNILTFLHTLLVALGFHQDTAIKYSDKLAVADFTNMRLKDLVLDILHISDGKMPMMEISNALMKPAIIQEDKNYVIEQVALKKLLYFKGFSPRTPMGVDKALFVEGENWCEPVITSYLDMILGDRCVKSSTVNFGLSNTYSLHRNKGEWHLEEWEASEIPVPVYIWTKDHGNIRFLLKNQQVDSISRFLHETNRSLPRQIYLLSSGFHSSDNIESESLIDAWAKSEIPGYAPRGVPTFTCDKAIQEVSSTLKKYLGKHYQESFIRWIKNQKEHGVAYLVWHKAFTDCTNANAHYIMMEGYPKFWTIYNGLQLHHKPSFTWDSYLEELNNA